MAAAHYYTSSEKYSNTSEIYLTIDSPPEPTENTPLLYSTLRSARPAYSDSGCSCSTTNDNDNNSFTSPKKTISIKITKKKCCCDLPLLGIGILLVGGCTIATYLLVVETRLTEKVGYALDLVNREVWSKMPLELNNLLNNNSNILHVLVVQTGGNECDEMENCVNLLREMQKIEKSQKNTEIPYNFLISGNGQAYEIRGWQYESGFHYIPTETSLVIGLIGNYTYKSPSTEQLTATISLIHESERTHKLHKTFQIYGVRNLTVSHRDGEALYNHVSKLHEFNTLLKIL